MKKFLLTLMILVMTSSSSAFAYYEVKYMNTGAVANFTPVAFGSNAPWLPGNREMQGQRAREIRRYNAETEAIKNMYNKNVNINFETNSSKSNNNNDNINDSINDNNYETYTNLNIKQPDPSRFRSKSKSKSKSNKKTTCNGITYYSENNPCNP